MVGELMGDYGTRFFIAVFGVGLGLLCLVGVLLILRRRSGPAPFLRGGKNRQPRLQVLDAAAVDARRRIVLVRRDNVEHLVMIGGPTDIVIESGIQGAVHGLSAQAPAPDLAVLGTAPPEPRLQAPARQQQLAAPQPDRDAPAAVIAAAPRPDSLAQEQRRAEPAPATDQRPQPILQQPAQPATTAERAPKEPPLQELLPTEKAEPRGAQTAGELPPAGAQAVAASAPAPIVETAQARPVAPTVAPPTTTGSEIGAAAEALDAARRRVFQPALDRTPVANPAPAASARPAETAPAQPQKPRSLGSEFDRILEEEMASNLANADVEPAIRAPSASLPKRDPAAPRVTGATPEPSLQNEIARIFGEMSVTRDDRQP